MGCCQNQLFVVVGGEFGIGLFEVFGFVQDVFGNCQYGFVWFGDVGKVFVVVFENGNFEFIFE